MALRIAQLAPPWLRVPPVTYGGIEWVVSSLSDELTERGHDVTLFAPGGSSTKAKLVSPFAAPPRGTDRIGELAPELLHALSCYIHAEDFDVIHDHGGLAGPAFGAFSQTPVIITVHGPFTPDQRRLYDLVKDRVNVVAISHAQAADMPDISYLDVIHNGIDVDAFPYQPEKEDYLAYVGRFTPEKGAHIAMDVARRLGMRLVLVGKAAEPHEKAYLQERIFPNLGPLDDYRGEVTEEEKRRIYAGARCVLFPINWHEPFGLVMVEALACGTPVIATRHGAVPEVMVDGVTGYIVDDPEDMPDRFGRLDAIDPQTCRQHVRENFSARAMVERYEAAYQRVIQNSA
ncbi:MAG TPA: glycosyltransferase family 4 protein [Actinomycetota bacterium]|nr:glycosyltransferase family 4 protein [Actinomycetota bacterium]